jgi:hypothetical protein
MSGKIRYSISFIVLLGLVLASTTNADLVARWKLDETSGNIASDSSGNGIDGVLEGGAAIVNDAERGPVFQQNDVVTNYISIADPGGLLNFSGTGPHQGSATIAAWVKNNNGNGWTNHDAIFNQGEWDDGISLTIKGDTSPAGQLWLAGDGTHTTVQRSDVAVPLDGWHHVAATFDYDGTNTVITFYLDGEPTGFAQGTGNLPGRVTAPVGGISRIGLEDRNGSAPRWPFNGSIDDVMIFDTALSQKEIQAAMAGLGQESGKATGPKPADEATDVPRDSVLSWTPGTSASKHDIYFGTDFDDVNNADTGSPLLVGPAQDAETFDPGRLEFDKSYFWRIDEINAPPDNTVFKGDVWSFTVEPLAIPIPGENIIATASSQAPDQGPEKTIDGSGLVNDLHSTELTDMWATSDSDTAPAWIQYEFDKAYKLNEMLVWNYNAPTLLSMIGFKDVVVEYSTDGASWSQVDNISQFTKAPGAINYAHNTTVSFDGKTVKYVRITASSNWSNGVFAPLGLSEVRFMVIPVFARQPSPAIEATDVAVDVTLGWRAGRDVAEHNVYISADQQAVIDGTAPMSVAGTSASGPLSLDMESTYYWRVDEVNNAETTTTWQGDVWSFTTQDYLTVDDFESYNDIETGKEGSNLVYSTWIDGFDNPSVNGSTMGYPTGASMETTIVYGGKQSVPLFYNNSTASKSEVTADPANLPIGRNWTKNGVETLSIRFYGDPNNSPEQMYVKVNDVKVPYAGELIIAAWQEISIDLASLGINLNNVTSITIGFERKDATGGSGRIFVDEIRLYPFRLRMPGDLKGMGINADFEEPNLNGTNSAEQYSYANLGMGWKREVISGDAAQNYGVQDPTSAYFGAQGPLPTPFEGRQTGFLNLSAPIANQTSACQVVSDPVAMLAAGQVYTLNVAVSTRFTSPAYNVRYDIGLRDSHGNDLGTFATTSISGADHKIVDLQYVLNVNANASGSIGRAVQIVIRCTNLAAVFSQGVFDNVRLSIE